MTLKNDLLLRAAGGERTERTPVWLMRQAGRFDPKYQELRGRHDLPLEELFCHPELAAEISLLPRRFGVDAIIFFQDILTPLAPMGARFIFRPGPVLERSVRSAAELSALRDFDPPEELAFVPKTLGLVKRALDGAMPLLGFAGAPLTLAFFLIAGKSPHGDPSAPRELMQSEPAQFHQLLERLAVMTARYLRMQIEAGVDAVQLFESAADLVSAEEYAEFALPYQQRVLAEVGGRVPTILFAKDMADVQLLAASGARVLSLSSEVDLGEAKRQLGRRAAVQGNVSNELLATGNQGEIESAVRECIRAGGHQGHILNLGHGVLQNTPVDHVVQFIETARSMRLPASATAVPAG